MSLPDNLNEELSIIYKAVGYTYTDGSSINAHCQIPYEAFGNEIGKLNIP